MLNGTESLSKPGGKHTIQFSGGSYYDGGLDDAGVEHGHGTYVWGNTRNWQQWPVCLYSGGFVHGVMEVCMWGCPFSTPFVLKSTHAAGQGEGFFTGKAGTYFGGYKGGRRHGAGVFFHSDGTVYFGTFGKRDAAGASCVAGLTFGLQLTISRGARARVLRPTGACCTSPASLCEAMYRPVAHVCLCHVTPCNVAVKYGLLHKRRNKQRTKKKRKKTKKKNQLWPRFATAMTTATEGNCGT